MYVFMYELRMYVCAYIYTVSPHSRTGASTPEAKRERGGGWRGYQELGKVDELRLFI
jgi:hypothetical protein